jgi:DNA-directed RNA polymerase
MVCAISLRKLRYRHQGNTKVPVVFVTHPVRFREQFISLHSSPILENLSQFFLQRFTHIPPHLRSTKKTAKNSRPEKMPCPASGDGAEDERRPAASYSLAEIETRKREMLFRQVPTKGSLDLAVVKDSIYFFS